MVIDCFTYNGELDILKLHIGILNEYVDKFIIVESVNTFSGYPKKLYFPNHQNYFKDLWRKIDYYIVDCEFTQEEMAIADNSPNTKGAAHWKNEFLQKESIHKAMKRHAKPNDIVFIGDVDEVWDWDKCKYLPDSAVYKLKLKVYAYWLNYRSDEQFWGTIVGKYRDIERQVLNHLRTNAPKIDFYCGWHFTSMGGLKDVKRKLNDSYTTESYNTIEIQQMLPDRLKNGMDYLGRDFKFTIDESDWPKYLKYNRNDYKLLLK